MLNRRSVRNYSLYLFLLVLGVLIGLNLDISMIDSASAAVEDAPSTNLNAPGATSSQHVCVPQNVAVFSNRIHIKCDTADTDGIRYFAAPTTDSKHVARILSLLLTAKASGKRVGVDYNSYDLSGAAIGCATSDCRLIRWVYIVN